MASTRWRVRCRAHNSDQIGLGDFRMYASTDATGTNLCSGGTPIAFDSYGGGYAASSAFDANDTTNWFANDGRIGGWVGYQFASAVDINSIRIIAGTEDLGGAPRIFDIESSNDGVTWAYEWTGFVAADYTSAAVIFARPVVQATYRYWGFHCEITQLGGHDWVCAEIQMATSSGGTDITTSTSGGLAFKPGNPGVANAFNNVLTDYFYANDSLNEAFISFNLGLGNDAAVTEARLRSTDESSGAGNSMRQAGTLHLYCSTDGLSFRRLATFTGQTWGENETKTFLMSGVVPVVLRRRQSIVL